MQQRIAHYTNIKIPTSTINLSFYHSKYRMNLIYYRIQILLILLIYWLNAKHQFNRINPYSFIIEYRFC